MVLLRKTSLQTRIFIAMILLVVIASILIAVITIFQFKEQTEDYHTKRLIRKEEAIKEALTYELKRPKNIVSETKLLPLILNEKLNEISDIHNLDINIYNLNGHLLRSSLVRKIKDSTDVNLKKEIVTKIHNNPKHRLVVPKITLDGKKFKSSFTYLLNTKYKPIGIVGVPYLQDNTFQNNELKEFLIRLLFVYIFILGIAISIAYFLSKYITKSLDYVTTRMRETALDKTNEKIVLEEGSEEINNLVNSYNNMIDQLEESAVKLAQIERNSAWREMAKQVAHEIKNPLTPMRLTVQSFAYSFDPTDKNIKEKLNEYSETLIQQIDIMSSIASAFSNFAQMPKQKKEQLNVVQEIRKSLNIFQESYIFYHPEKETITAKLDKTQLTRIITNLITNAIHALKTSENPRIDLFVFENNNEIIIQVKDNGYGISKEDALKIFEPKFTTKSSGMGLGLPMVKNIIEAYNGNITFQSEIQKGTVFIVTLPKN